MKRITISLSNLPVDEQATVLEIHTKGNMRRRMQDMGIVEGAKIKALLNSPSGGIRAYEIWETVIAVREKNAAEIFVTTEQ